MLFARLLLVVKLCVLMMKNKTKFVFAVAVACAAVTACAVSVSAVSVYSAESYWSGVDSVLATSSSLYNASSYNISTSVNTAVRDWGIPFPGDSLLPYVTDKAVLVRSYGGTGKEPFSYDAIVIKYKKPVTLTASGKYSLFAEMASISSSPGTTSKSLELGSVLLLDSNLKSSVTGVTASYVMSTVYQYKDSCVKCTFDVGSSDVTFYALALVFEHPYGEGIIYNEVDIRMRFSGFVSYVGDPAFEQVNPQLEKIKSDIMGSPDDTAQVPDIIPGIHDKDNLIDSVESGQSRLADNLDDYMAMLNVPDGSSFWSSLGGFFSEAGTINAILWWGNRYDEVMTFSPVQIILYFGCLCVVTALIFGCCRWGYYHIKVKGEPKSARGETLSQEERDDRNMRSGKWRQQFRGK